MVFLCVSVYRVIFFAKAELFPTPCHNLTVWVKFFHPSSLLSFLLKYFIIQCLYTEWWASPDSSVGKESACNAGDPSLIPGSGRSPGEGVSYLLQYSWASFVAQLVKNLPAMGRPGFDPWVGKIPWRRERLPTPVFWPGEYHGLYSPCGCKELDTTERLSLSISGFDKTKGWYSSLKFYIWILVPFQR